MVTPTIHVIVGPDLHRAGPLALWRFSQHLFAKYRGRPKKVLQFERRAPSWYFAILWSIRPWLMHFVHKKVIWGSEKATFKDKNSPFLPGYTLKLAGKNWIEGAAGPLVFHSVVSYCCKRKMLKRNWNWTNSRLFGTFLLLVKFQLGGGFPGLPPLVTPTLQLRKPKEVFANFPRGF